MRINANKIITIILAVVAALCVAAVAYTFLRPAPPGQAPDLTGMTLMEATETAQEYGLEIKDGQVKVGEAENKGKIVEQMPLPGTEMQEGDTIVVHICIGLGDGKVPDVEGMSKEDAKEAIEKAGFNLDETKEVASAEPKGTVLKQHPKAGKEYEKGKNMDIEVSDGTMVYVPNLYGKSYDSAMSIINKMGFKYDYVEEQFSNKVSAGCVLKQSPGAGAVVARGTTIKLWFSLGPEWEWDDEDDYDDDEDYDEDYDDEDY